ncbi:hypothetical protein [Methanoregula sp.]|jgi:hypothetical protein|uniref:hypothetical protein n=1 Tax=Methanoregula sp. TaxID=2052170 RepID=UPI003C28535C
MARRLKAQGEKNPVGITKIVILTLVFNNTEGVTVDGIRDVLFSRFGIIERDPIKEHLKYFVEKGYVQQIQPTPQDDPVFKPTNDIKKFKELWLDVPRIWKNADKKEMDAFISTHRVSQFIEKDIVPAFIGSPVSITIKGEEPFEVKDLYANLPHNEQYRQNPEFKRVCIWAVKSCPLLITHIFKPNNQVLLCLSMTLQRSLNLPDVKRSLSSLIDLSPQELSENFARIGGYIRDDWYRIRFSSGSISKEMVCILTMITCFYIYLERSPDRDLAKSYYTNENYLALWGQYKMIMEQLSRENQEILMDAMKIVFIVSLTDQLLHENQTKVKIPPNAF